MKIFMVGIVASGKTTLVRKLSNILKIKHYEIDYDGDDIADATIDSPYVPSNDKPTDYNYRFRAVSNSGLNSPWSEPFTKLQ